jgi:hypothetical protein
MRSTSFYSLFDFYCHFHISRSSCNNLQASSVNSFHLLHMATEPIYGISPEWMNGSKAKPLTHISVEIASGASPGASK